MSAHSVNVSLYGRRFGLNTLPTTVSKGSKGPIDFLVGQLFGGIRNEVQAATSDTTGTGITAWGLTTVDTSTDDTWLLDPPVPGVMKMIYTGSTSTGIRTIKRKDATFAIRTTASSSMTTIVAQGGGQMLTLEGITTAIYGIFSRSNTSTELAFNGTT